MIKVEIVADSLSPQGDRLTSVLATFPRIILAEVNTHRMLSKNTSSSRAIPFNKMVEAVQNNPFIPIAWQKEHKGMQGSEYITDKVEIKDTERSWLIARDCAIQEATNLNNLNKVTKQLCNRLLEPFMWTTMLITGSKEGWDNFFHLRCPQYTTPSGDYVFRSKKDFTKSFAVIKDFDWKCCNKGQAEIHMMALAECVWDAFNESTPKQLKAGEWHIPFNSKIDFLEEYLDVDNNYIPMSTIDVETRVKISTAMAAHTSYTLVGNEPVKSYEKWIELHDKLIAYNPPHSSPMEHCARAMYDREYYSFVKGRASVEDVSVDTKDKWFTVFNIYTGDNNWNSKTENNEDICGWCYNLKGFIPYRYMIDNNYGLNKVIAKLSAMVYDGEYWSGWSNSKGSNHVPDLKTAKQFIKDNKELGWSIIDADNLTIYISDECYIEKTIKAAKVNFDVVIPLENVFIGEEYLDK